MNQLPPAGYRSARRRSGCPLGCLGTLVLIAIVLIFGKGLVGGWLAQPSTAPVLVRPSPHQASNALSAEDLRGLGTKVAPAIVDINTELGERNAVGAGTGIVLNSDGEILTNNHVINGATAIRANDLGDGREYQAEVLGYDRANDVAVLRLRDASGLTVASLGSSDGVAVGAPVAAIGNAGGKGGAPTVAGGTVIALNRSVRPTDELTGSTEQLDGLIEVAADVEPGDSGGPLVDRDGQVIGMDTAASVNYRYQASGGTGFAIPIDSAISVARRIIAGQSSDTVHVGPTGILGVSVLTDNSQTQTSGAVVAAVQPGSPADTAGLGPGTVIVELDGQQVDSATTLTNLLLRHHPGDQVSLQWVDRTGQGHRSTLELATGPPA